MENLTTRPLTPETWQDFEKLFGKHKGVRGGCWCSFYLTYAGEYAKLDREGRKAWHYNCIKSGLHTGILVYEGKEPVAWCQFGAPDVIKRFERCRSLQQLGLEKPAWRISCVFTDKDRRKKGLASFAVRAALKTMKEMGGGVAEAFPFHFGDGANNKFQHNRSVSFYESLGFEQVAPIGSCEVLMRKTIE